MSVCKYAYVYGHVSAYVDAQVYVYCILYTVDVCSCIRRCRCM